MTRETRILYNDHCPVCAFEINHYRSYATKSRLPLRFDSLNGPERADCGVSTDDAARRLHVLQDGEIHSGIDAFRILWSEMPRYRWLSKAVSLPGVRPVAHVVYEHVLARILYRWHLKRIAKRGAAAGAMKQDQ